MNCINKIKTVNLMEEISNYASSSSMGCYNWGFKIEWAEGRGEWVATLIQPQFEENIPNKTYEGANSDLYEALKKLKGKTEEYLD